MRDKKRVDTLRILISGHSALATSPKLNIIVGELNRISASSRQPGSNGWLLKVLHTTRSLDTTLSELLQFKRWTASRSSLGSYISAFSLNGILRLPEKQRFENDIVRKRNRYMHEAGAMPTQIEADKILSEMHACVAMILARL